MKLKNTTKHDLSEVIFGYGEVRLGAGKTAEIPDAVAALWLNPSRQEVCVEEVTETTAPSRRTGGRKEVVEETAEDAVIVDLD